ncbi:unnamed protein product, partial [Adineta steineri]
MFVSTLPYRLQLDRHCSFDDLVKYVQEKCLSILEHSHYPLQHILANLHINQSNISFLETIDIAIYNELSTLQVVQGSLSITRLLQAFRYVLNKHKILR